MDKLTSYYGRIDLTKIGEIIKKDPQAVKNVTFKDGVTHKFIDVNIGVRKEPDQYSNVAFIKVGVKKSDVKADVNYYIGDLKESQYGSSQQSSHTSTASAAQVQEGNDDLPF